MITIVILHKYVADMGWECNPFNVPTTNLVDDFYRLVKLIVGRRPILTVFPFLYVYPNIYPKYVLTGWGADGYGKMHSNHDAIF